MDNNQDKQLRIRERGVAAEERGVDHLVKLGYTIIKRNYRCPGGEIDIIAMDGEELVFVEVKYRQTGVVPEESIESKKTSLLERAARHYLKSAGLSGKPFRIDLIAIEGSELRYYRAGIYSEGGPYFEGNDDDETPYT